MAQMSITGPVGSTTELDVFYSNTRNALRSAKTITEGDAMASLHVSARPTFSGDGELIWEICTGYIVIPLRRRTWTLARVPRYRIAMGRERPSGSAILHPARGPAPRVRVCAIHHSRHVLVRLPRCSVSGWHFRCSFDMCGCLTYMSLPRDNQLRSPQFLYIYRQLFGTPTATIDCDDPDVSMMDVMGCSATGFLSLAEIAALAHWKEEQVCFMRIICPPGTVS